jgi:hypothetical protein
LILVDVHDLPAGSLGNLAELTLLVGRGLIDCRNPEIKDCALHDFPHSMEGRISKICTKIQSYFRTAESESKKLDFSVLADVDFSGGYFVHPLRAQDRARAHT